ncbi:hypothetical protein CWS72_00240 [Telmatospirillum siberiense]|uniref:Cytoskeleton protein RodZ-like C-terminal domain-containing protein n=2 Tax=Telmatospirillum siberiense TaxID=382514 RepID=A0A2N3Q0Z7_9PROT|nr:hypothetical protein CWS72_00240 [Telmatospirillum siberiense]
MGVTAPAEATGSVGSLLREARERRGEDLGFVANALRIRQPYLRAIEAGRSDDLPGSTYAVGFVRGYAEYLGLDSKEIVRRFRQENGEFNNRAELVFPSAVSEGSIPTGALLGFAVLAAAAAYGAWYWYQSRDPSVATAVPALPERLAALIHQPVGSGSELVPVDGNKVNEVPQPPPAAAAPAAVPTVTPSQGSVPTSSPHEDVIPPAEDDGASSSQAAPGVPVTPVPAVTPSSAPAPLAPSASPAPAPAAAPVGDAAVSRSQDGKPGRDARNKTVRPPEPAKPAEPPADAAVSSAYPDGSQTGAATESASPAADAAKPARDARNKARAKTDAVSTAVTGEGVPAETPSGEGAKPVIPAAPSSRVVLKATEDCWIEIRDRNGKIVQKRLLRKGESYSAPTRAGMRMTVGNAGALAVEVDGKETSGLGRAGMVRHDVPLDPERLKNGLEPAPEPVAPAGPPAEAPAGTATGGE